MFLIYCAKLVLFAILGTFFGINVGMELARFSGGRPHLSNSWETRTPQAVITMLLLTMSAIWVYLMGFSIAFFAAIVTNQTQMPEISHRWLYYVATYCACGATTSSLFNSFAIEMGIEYPNQNPWASIFMLGYSSVYVVFCLWPNLSSWLYGWALKWLV